MAALVQRGKDTSVVPSRPPTPPQSQTTKHTFSSSPQGTRSAHLDSLQAGPDQVGTHHNGERHRDNIGRKYNGNDRRSFALASTSRNVQPALPHRVGGDAVGVVRAHGGYPVIQPPIFSFSTPAHDVCRRIGVLQKSLLTGVPGNLSSRCISQKGQPTKHWVIHNCLHVTVSSLTQQI